MNTAAPAFPVDVHRPPSRDCRRRFVALACIKIYPGTSYVVLPINGFSWRVWDFGPD